MKLKLALLAGMPVAMSLTLNAASQSLLAEAHFSRGIGDHGLVGSVNLVIGLGTNANGGPPIPVLFTNVYVGAGDVDRTFTVGPGDDPNFAPFVAYLTDGKPDLFSFWWMVGNVEAGEFVSHGGGGLMGVTEARFFDSLPPASNGIDLSGFQVDYITLCFTSLEFSYTTNSPGDDIWTDNFGVAVFSVYGEPFPFAPTNIVSPQSQAAEAGSYVSLYAGADAYPPPHYQWLFGGTEMLPGATNSFLVFSNVQPAQSGCSYAAVISNSCGAVTSDTATLSIIAPVPKRTVPMLHLTGEPNSLLHLIYSDTPAPGTPWRTLDSLTLTNSPQLYLDLFVSDPMPPSRFYRGWQATVPGMPPALEVGMATDITLAGMVGSKVRIDFINQFGPTNAWVTLDTVTMTNEAQPYFDLTMWRQPARLYRLLPVP